MQYFGIAAVVWDRSDRWTRNYVKGGTNRTPSPRPDINLWKLPKARSVEQARLINVVSLELPARLRMCVRRIAYQSLTFTLGDMCELTQMQAAARVKDGLPAYRLVGRNLEMVKKLFRHYGLSFKDELAD